MCTNMKSLEKLKRFRVLVLVNFITDIPFELNFENNYFIEYEFLN